MHEHDYMCVSCMFVWQLASVHGCVAGMRRCDDIGSRLVHSGRAALTKRCKQVSHLKHRARGLAAVPLHRTT